MFARMRFDRLSLLIGEALIGLFLLAAPLPAAAQSCSLCYTRAASSGARMIQALRSGILILIVPPTFMSVGMIFIVYRKRNQFRQPDDTPESERNW
jgi:hypothetical protein